MDSLILVAEDNEKILYNIKLILEINNYKVFTAKNGKEALKILSELKQFPDVIHWLFEHVPEQVSIPLQEPLDWQIW